MLIAVYRVTLAAFGILTLAAIVDQAEPLAWCFGLVFIGAQAIRFYVRHERSTRRYDSTFPKAVDEQATTLDALPDEQSQTRAIRGRSTARTGKDIAS
jgi:hypothetical protein